MQIHPGNYAFHCQFCGHPTEFPISEIVRRNMTGKQVAEKLAFCDECRKPLVIVDGIASVLNQKPVTGPER